MEKIIADEDVERDRQEVGSPSSDGKMVIKLKIPKLAAAMECEKSSSIGSLETAKEGETMNQGKRVCPECKKEFSSGKALGGHMRIHANKNTFLKPSKTTKFKKADFNNGDDQKEQTKPYYESCINENGNPTCSLCGKVFPSMKSLFGHMRCHPDRFWRGILPPPNIAKKPSSFALSSSSSSSSLSENNEESSNIVDDQVVDLTQFIRGWSVTDRRGRQAKRKAEDDEDFREAVEDLMNLAQADPSMAESDVTQRQVFEGSNGTNKDDKIEEKSPEKMEFDGGNESDGRNTEEQLLINFKYNTSTPDKNPTKIKKRKKMKLVLELELTPPPSLLPVTEESKYKCTTCNKRFASHQALGGHRSSHNKSKTELDDYENYQAGENMEREVEFAADAMGSNGIHQCKICDKIFPTGQALGGHKRCHWTGTTEAQAPSSQITSTGEAASQTGNGRKVVEFDLNEVPPMTMEDEGGSGNGNGYASSSYTSNMG